MPVCFNVLLSAVLEYKCREIPYNDQVCPGLIPSYTVFFIKVSDIFDRSQYISPIIITFPGIQILSVSNTVSAA